MSDAAAGGGVTLNAHSKGLNSTVGLNSTGVIPAVVLQPSREDIRESGQPFAVEAGSAIRSHLSHTPAKTPVNTAGSTVDHSERQVRQQKQQHSTAQCHVPLTQGGPARTSGGGDAVGVQQLQQHSTVQNSTDLTDHGRQTVSGRPGVGERQSDQNLLPVSPLGDAEYDAHLRLSAEQRVQLVQQNLSDGLVDPPRGESGAQLGVAVSGERTPCVDPLFGQPRLSTPVDCEVRSDLLSHSSGVSTGISALQNAAAQSVPVLNSTAGYSTVQYSKVPEGVPEGVTDSTPESSDSDCDSERSVSGGGGGRINTDRTDPLTSDVPVESEPTCKASVNPRCSPLSRVDRLAEAPGPKRRRLLDRMPTDGSLDEQVPAPSSSQSTPTGFLQDDTDVSWMLAKALAIALDSEDARAAASGAKKLGPTQSKFRFASLCSGSGLGDVGLHRLIEAFNRVSGTQFPHGECSFLCENDPRKAAHLGRLMTSTAPEDVGMKPYVFKDITQLSAETADIWDSNARVPVPPTDFLFYDFSCKDVSAQNKNSHAMTQCSVVLFNSDARFRYP